MGSEKRARRALLILGLVLLFLFLLSFSLGRYGVPPLTVVKILAARFVELAAECGRSGEPMIRNLEYCFPGMGYAGVKDQFMMGDYLLVAPV